MNHKIVIAHAEQDGKPCTMVMRVVDERTYVMKLEEGGNIYCLIYKQAHVLTTKEQFTELLQNTRESDLLALIHNGLKYTGKPETLTGEEAFTLLEHIRQMYRGHIDYRNN